MVDDNLNQVVDKSENDSREYRLITLRNGLRALLVADQTKTSMISCICSDTDRDSASDLYHDYTDDDEEAEGEDCYSAASLCIGVGSFCDPPEIPGLAHFLEHMVFMGSQKYPDENEFDKFVSKHSGNTNATTDVERTVFHFDVQQKGFEQTLDRFAQFFVSPLLNADSVERELKAVDNEWNMLLTSDSARKEQMIASFSKPGHPMGSLLYGNKATLQRTPGGKSAYDLLPQFCKDIYSAHYMTLAVICRDSLDNMQRLVTRIFSDIPNNGKPQPDFSNLGNPLDTQDFTKLYKVIPVKNIHQVMLTWALPPLMFKYKVKPLVYLSYLISHQGEGSILAFLRTRYWAVDLKSGPCEDGFDNNRTCSIFHLTVCLTDDGLAHVYEVLCAIFEYLSMLRHVGPQGAIFREIMTIDANGFRYQEQTDAVEFVELLCKSMQIYPTAHIITGEELMFEYDPQLIKQVTDLLSPRKANVMIVSQVYEALGICDQEEKWFGTRYSTQDIPAEWLKKWDTKTTSNIFHVPTPNVYIPKDFSLIEKAKKTEYPVILTQTALSTLWYKKDYKFKVPKTFVKFELTSPVMSESPLAACMFDVFLRALDYNLSDIGYAAKTALFNFKIESKETALTIEVYGFNDTLACLFEKIVDHIANFQICQALLDSCVEELGKLYANESIKPFVLAREVREQILYERHWSPVDRLGFLSYIKVESIESFVSSMKRKLSVQGLVQGNMTPANARWLENMLLEKFKCTALPKGVVRELRVCRLPEGESYCRVRNMNSRDSNSVITNYYQHGPATLKEAVTNDLLMNVMEEPMFDTLRTREQLGYSVYCSHRVDLGIIAFSLTVCSQADKFNMTQLDKHMEEFLVEFEEMLEDMTAATFKARKDSLIMMKQCDDTSLDVECTSNWSEISGRTFMFDRLNREIKELECLSKKEFLNWFKKHTSEQGTRKLSIQVVGNVAEAMDTNHTAAPNTTISITPNESEKKGAFSEGVEGMQSLGSAKPSLGNLFRLQYLPMHLPDVEHVNMRDIKDTRAFRDSCYLYPVSKIL